MSDELKGRYYNGFSPAERHAKSQTRRSRHAQGVFDPPPAKGRCMLCGDPKAERVEYHSEDYEEPFSWKPPACYVLCLPCHRHWLHRRFGNPTRWAAFKAHVRRGGYARDLKDKPAVKEELTNFAVALHTGEKPPRLRRLRARRLTGKEWWEKLTVDPASRTHRLPKELWVERRRESR